MTISSVTSMPVSTIPGDGARSFVPVTPPAASAAPASAVATATPETQAPSPERVARAVDQVNEAFTQKGHDLYAAIERDKATGIHIVKVVDTHTEEIISQFPSKEIIAIAEAIGREQEDKGQLLNVRA